MLVLKLVNWAAYASAAGWTIWALSQRLDADVLFGLACAVGSFAVGAFFAGMDRIVTLLSGDTSAVVEGSAGAEISPSPTSSPSPDSVV